MAIKYKLVLRRDPDAVVPGGKKYYASSVAKGKCTFDELCETVADRSSATAGDVKLVLDGMVHVLRTRLLAGDIVEIGGLGNFRPTLGSHGVTLKENFSTELIKTRNIRFYPAKVLRETAKFFLVERIPEPKDPSEEPSNPEGGL